MSVTEQDIASTPMIVRQTINLMQERGEAFARSLQGQMVFLGSGSSYRVGIAAASIYEVNRSAAGQAILSSEYRSRPNWGHVAISRTGQTSKLVHAMRSAREAGAPVALIVGDSGSPAET